ncbi:MAG TPA: copper amine oxidase N-terminal domain-containing protein [Candidatus Bathyarchaeia archaeon]|nr:copper amine oxidase N-terminal domain-containing protein [Candidatus Bathyarchaeia archaeon]
MKRLFTSMIAIAMSLTIVTNVSAEWEGYIMEGINVKVNNIVIEFPDKKPYLVYTYDRVMIPVRFVSEALGAKVEWDINTKTLKMIRSGKTITMKLGEKQAFVNGERYLFESPAVMKDNRIFVPLRFISEIFGCKVEYLSQEKTAVITGGELQPIKDSSGANIPVNNSNPYFQAFHKSLKIKDGMLSFTVPKSQSKNIDLQLDITFKDRKSDVLSQGSFSFKARDVEGLHFFVIDRNKQKRLASFVYSIPSLNPTDFTNAK